MDAYPVELKRLETGHLLIAWSDGQRRQYSYQELRDRCPCATCREKRAQTAHPSLLPILTAQQAQPLNIEGMRPVGNYAYCIEFSDGHDSGIFTFELLRELGASAA